MLHKDATATVVSFRLDKRHVWLPSEAFPRWELLFPLAPTCWGAVLLWSKVAAKRLNTGQPKAAVRELIPLSDTL